MDGPLPFNSTESITLCLISAAIASEKRCRSRRGEHSAFEKSSWCSFQIAGGRGRGKVALPLYFTAVFAPALDQKWSKMLATETGCGAAPLRAMGAVAAGVKDERGSPGAYRSKELLPGGLKQRENL